MPHSNKLIALEELEKAGMKFSMADWEFDKYEAMFDVDTNTERPTSRQISLAERRKEKYMKLAEQYKRQGKIKGYGSPSSKCSKRESDSTKYESHSVTSPFSAESNMP